MNPLLFLRRIRHCAGFGVQSPTDYAFVRNVIYERLPYYAYEELDEVLAAGRTTDRWKARLLLRVANHAQAEKMVYCGAQVPEYVQKAVGKGCGKTQLLVCGTAEKLCELAREDGAWVVVPGIYKANRDMWEQLTSLDNVVAFDLYYLGIAFIDKKRYAETHIINPY